MKVVAQFKGYEEKDYTTKKGNTYKKARFDHIRIDDGKERFSVLTLNENLREDGFYLIEIQPKGFQDSNGYTKGFFGYDIITEIAR